ncbi:hypothetical protein B1R32_13117 [Abditibacterium utsteinense]|uniref:Uncharacterized protein n=2 Tax=Abditibacterium utsteinense TaxID=1960156 RepID=A0A2S8SNY1_9BACT|nr:hypothetical protein B1R32_13117 [Abditibacterium utsteinense]
MKRLLQPLLSLALVAVCVSFALGLIRQSRRENMLSIPTYSWDAHPNAIVILQRSSSNCGCTPKISEMAMTGLSHGLDVLVMANADAGEAPALQKANLSKSISVVMPLSTAWKDRFFPQKQDLVMVRVRNGKVIKVVQNGVPPESFFR